MHEDATKRGITLELDAGVLVNAPFDELFNAASPLRLTADDDDLRLELHRFDRPRGPRPPAARLSRRHRRRRRGLADTTMSHADRIRVSPIAGCA